MSSYIDTGFKLYLVYKNRETIYEVYDKTTRYAIPIIKYVYEYINHCKCGVCEESRLYGRKTLH